VHAVRDVARVFGVTVSAVDQWRREGCACGPGNWDLAAIGEWLRRRKMANRGDDPEVAYKRARADLAQLRLAKERGLLCDQALADAQILRACTTFRTALMGAVTTLAQQMEGLDEAARAEAIDRRFREVLEAVAENVGAIVERPKKKRGARKGPGA